MTDLFSENGQDLIYLWSIPIHATVILMEMLYSHFNKANLYKTKDVLSNVYLALCNYGLDLLMKGISMGVMFFFYHHRIFNWDFTIGYFIAVFVLQDFAYYVLHCVDHKSRAFWAVHITHHSSDHFNLTTGFRSSVFEPLYRYLFFSPLAFLGFNPWHIMVAYSLFQVYGAWVHTQTINKLGLLEWILVTPSHHRVHHACNIRYLDRNMGMALIIWDKLFGTFEKEVPEVPVKYGIYPKMEKQGPADLIFYEWRKIKRDISQPNLSILDKLKYLFYAPGWRHDGKGKTVKDYQREELVRRQKSETMAKAKDGQKTA